LLSAFRGPALIPAGPGGFLGGEYDHDGTGDVTQPGLRLAAVAHGFVKAAQVAVIVAGWPIALSEVRYGYLARLAGRSNS